MAEPTSLSQLSDEELISRIQSYSTGGTGKPSLLQRSIGAASKTEEKIGKRGSSIGFLRRVVQDPRMATQHPFMTGLSAVGAPFEALESIPANIGLGVQQRKPFNQVGKDVGAGIVGERPAQLGDIARASGIPFLSSEPVAATIGLGASLSPGLLTRTGQRLATRASEEVVGQASGAGSMATVSSRAKLAGRIAEIPEQARELASKKFGQAIDEAAAKQVADPSLLFDLQEVGQALQPVKGHLKSGTRHAGSDLATLLADDPSLGTNISLADARAIKAGIQRSLEINRPTEAGRILRQARDLIRAQEVEKLGLGETFSEFRNVMKAYRDIHPKTARLGHTTPVATGLKSLTESEVTRKGLEKIASQSGQRQGFAEVLGAARTAGVGQAIGRTIPWLLAPAAGTLGYFLGRKKYQD